MFYRYDVNANLKAVHHWGQRLPIFIQAVQLDNKFKPIPGTDQQIDIPTEGEGVSFEDPRVTVVGDDLWMTLAESDWKFEAK